MAGKGKKAPLRVRAPHVFLRSHPIQEDLDSQESWDAYLEKDGVKGLLYYGPCTSLDITRFSEKCSLPRNFFFVIALERIQTSIRDNHHIDRRTQPRSRGHLRRMVRPLPCGAVALPPHQDRPGRQPALILHGARPGNSSCPLHYSPCFCLPIHSPCLVSSSLAP
jgi:hypothetical protein